MKSKPVVKRVAKTKPKPPSFKPDRILGHWCVVLEDANRLPLAVVRATKTRNNARHIAAMFNTLLQAEDAGTL
jgi:hypothetical protein